MVSISKTLFILIASTLSLAQASPSGFVFEIYDPAKPEVYLNKKRELFPAVDTQCPTSKDNKHRYFRRCKEGSYLPIFEQKIPATLSWGNWANAKKEKGELSIRGVVSPSLFFWGSMDELFREDGLPETSPLTSTSKIWILYREDRFNSPNVKDELLHRSSPAFIFSNGLLRLETGAEQLTTGYISSGVKYPEYFPIALADIVKTDPKGDEISTDVDTDVDWTQIHGELGSFLYPMHVETIPPYRNQSYRLSDNSIAILSLEQETDTQPPAQPRKTWVGRLLAGLFGR